MGGRSAVAASVTDDVERLRNAEWQFRSSAEPWLSRREWSWTLAGLGLAIAFLRIAV